ncbi:transglutaminase N-terminal domain-containing protein [Rhodoblastus sphagnicola]
MAPVFQTFAFCSSNHLKIHHRTTCRYRHPASLGPHRLMLRP